MTVAMNPAARPSATSTSSHLSKGRSSGTNAGITIRYLFIQMPTLTANPMTHIAAIPGLRRLRAQGAVADDDGFEALSHSRTLESFWGRECAKLGSRGFMALSRMPALRGLGVSLKNVDDEALSALPRFPALRELTPIDVRDEGFRHVGRCERLTRLTCMYCRDTTDVATAHIAGLQLQYYYAGLTQITDRSLEVLGGMATLEQVEFYECKGVTDAGLPFLARLPRLREVHLDGLPAVTFSVSAMNTASRSASDFPTSVRKPSCPSTAAVSPVVGASSAGKSSRSSTSS